MEQNRCSRNFKNTRNGHKISNMEPSDKENLEKDAILKQSLLRAAALQPSQGGCTACINDGDFIFALDADPNYEFSGIYRYSVLSDEWTRWIPYPDDCKLRFPHNCVSDQKNNALYICEREKIIVSIDLEEKQCSSKCIKSLPTDPPSCVVMVDEALYIFFPMGAMSTLGSSEAASCYISNFVNKIPYKRDIPLHALIKGAVYVPSENSIIIIAGKGRASIVFIAWSLEQDTFSKECAFDLPMADVHTLSATPTADERFIIISGHNVFGAERDCLCILDRSGDEYQFLESTTSPFQSYHVAVSRGATAKDEVLVCGYCRTESKDIIPSGIVVLITGWLGFERIHFIELAHEWDDDVKEKSHCAISLAKIIESAKAMNTK